MQKVYIFGHVCCYYCYCCCYCIKLFNFLIILLKVLLLSCCHQSVVVTTALTMITISRSTPKQNHDNSIGRSNRMIQLIAMKQQPIHNMVKSNTFGNEIINDLTNPNIYGNSKKYNSRLHLNHPDRVSSWNIGFNIVNDVVSTTTSVTSDPCHHQEEDTIQEVTTNPFIDHDSISYKQQQQQYQRHEYVELISSHDIGVSRNNDTSFDNSLTRGHLSNSFNNIGEGVVNVTNDDRIDSDDDILETIYKKQMLSNLSTTKFEEKPITEVAINLSSPIEFVSSETKERNGNGVKSNGFNDIDSISSSVVNGIHLESSFNLNEDDDDIEDSYYDPLDTYDITEIAFFGGEDPIIDIRDNYDVFLYDVKAIQIEKDNEIYTCAIDYDNIERPYTSRMDSLSTFIEYTDDGSVVVPSGPIGQIKEWVACILAEPITEIIICTLVIMNCIIVALSTLPSLEIYCHLFNNYEKIFGIIFTIEIISRWWSSSSNRFHHVLNGQFIIDAFVVLVPMFLDILPTPLIKEYLPVWFLTPSTLVNLKLLRVLRLRRVLQDKTTFSKFEIALGLRKKSNGDFTRVKDWQLRLARVLLSLLTLLSVSSGMIYSAEHDVNPAFSDFFTALYFGLTTLTTVGFGDITPITWQGRLVVSGSILAGIAIIPAQAAALVEALLVRQNDQSSTSNNQKSNDNIILNNDLLLDSNNSKNDNGVNGRRSVFIDISTDNNKQHIDTVNSFESLDVAGKCSNCQQTMHWSHAKYCWSCGYPLRTNKYSQEDTKRYTQEDTDL